MWCLYTSGRRIVLLDEWDHSGDTTCNFIPLKGHFRLLLASLYSPTFTAAFTFSPRGENTIRHIPHSCLFLFHRHRSSLVLPAAGITSLPPARSSSSASMLDSASSTHCSLQTLVSFSTNPCCRCPPSLLSGGQSSSSLPAVAAKPAPKVPQRQSGMISSSCNSYPFLLMMHIVVDGKKGGILTAIAG